MAQILLTKELLLARLGEQRVVAVRFDKEALTKHRVEEKKYLDEFRANCREATKWDYEEAKKRHFEVRPERDGSRSYYGTPSCPMSMVVSIDKAIHDVSISSRAKYTLNNSGIHTSLYKFVTWDPDAVTDEALC